MFCTFVTHAKVNKPHELLAITFNLSNQFSFNSFSSATLHSFSRETKGQWAHEHKSSRFATARKCTVVVLSITQKERNFTNNFVFSTQKYLTWCNRARRVFGPFMRFNYRRHVVDLSAFIYFFVAHFSLIKRTTMHSHQPLLSVVHCGRLFIRLASRRHQELLTLPSVVQPYAKTQLFKFSEQMGKRNMIGRIISTSAKGKTR